MSNLFSWKILLCAFAIYASVNQTMTAQQATLQLDPDTFLTGEPVLLKMQFAFNPLKNEELYWPQFSDTLNAHIEILERGNVDTVTSSSAYELTLEQLLTVTSWDSGYWAIAPFTFIHAGDTTASNFVFAEVLAPAVDTAAEFRDIKDIYEAELSFADWLRKYWPWLAGGALAIAAIICFIPKFFRKRNSVIAVQEVAQLMPPFEHAMQQLEQLRLKELWQKGMVKEFHSELADILRLYIENVYHVPAMEETTMRIVLQLAAKRISRSRLDELGRVLQLADMVKFAKHKPGETEHELAFSRIAMLIEEMHQQEKTEH